MSSFINRALSKVAPATAVQRELDLIRFKALSETGKVTAGSNEMPSWRETRWPGASRVLRSMASWFAAVGSGTSDLNKGELRTLRARSRDAIRTYPLARAAMARSRTNIVGTGLMCHPSIDYVTLGLTPDQAEETNALLRSGWERWAEDPRECDAESTLDIYGLQSLALFSAMLSGDCFATTPYEVRPGGISGLKVQLLEADRIETPGFDADRVGLYEGVALSVLPAVPGCPIGYWVRSNHPGDSLATATAPTWTFFDAFGAETGRRRVMHVWNDKERPGQVRGAPFLSSVLEPLRQLAKWSDNELMAAVVSSMFTVFIEKGADAFDANGDPISAFGGMPYPNDPTGPDPSTFLPPATASNVALGNGAIVELANGDKANFANPSRPNAQFDPFFTAVTKQIGAALELPLDELLLHYQASYSAARAAMLQAWRFYLLRRTALAGQFCQPIYCLHLDEEVASGRISLPGYADPIKRRAWSNALWIGPARGAMDELKEAMAAEKRIEIGVSNESIECAAMTGETRDQIYAQQVREINQRKKDMTWDKRPASATRYSATVDPFNMPEPVSDPSQVDNPPDDGSDPGSIG